MTTGRGFFIDGRWVAAEGHPGCPVVNPATGRAEASIAIGNTDDIDRAVRAARAAFAAWSVSSITDRIALIERIIAAYEPRREDIAQAITREMGAPIANARAGQVAMGIGHFQNMLEILRDFPFEERIGDTLVVREAAGVVGLITPWNFPMNQVTTKVAPAIAAGCTIVLKPSEVSPGAALILAEIFDAAGAPPGLFNVVTGDGSTGAALAAHPDVDMVSFTGSTRAGVAVSKAAATTVKRVTLELGGKSPFIVLPDADLEEAVTRGAETCFRNSGQVCTTPSRMLVPRDRLAEAEQLATAVAERCRVGDPNDPANTHGPVASEAQYEKVQRLIAAGEAEGARLVAGGAGRPAGIDHGWFVRPTVFSDVRNDMAIAREEIFGPVVTIIPYDDEAEAIRVANDTPYGLSSVVNSSDPAHARRVARQIRAGMVSINGAPIDRLAPFGGMKQSGNGREGGRYGLEEYTELKAMFGHGQ